MYCCVKVRNLFRTSSKFEKNAIKNNNLELVELLLKHGAKIDIADEEGNTPISLAYDLKQKKIIELITKYNDTQK